MIEALNKLISEIINNMWLTKSGTYETFYSTDSIMDFSEFIPDFDVATVSVIEKYLDVFEKFGITYEDNKYWYLGKKLRIVRK